MTHDYSSDTASTFLSRDEVQELTGLRQRRAQTRWLTDRGWRFEVAAGGFVKILRAEMQQKMLSGGSSVAHRRKLRMDKIAA